MKIKKHLIWLLVYIVYFAILVTISLDWPKYTREAFLDFTFAFRFLLWFSVTFPPLTGLISIVYAIYKICKNKYSVMDMICIIISMITIVLFGLIIMVNTNLNIDFVFGFGIVATITIFANWIIEYVNVLKAKRK